MRILFFSVIFLSISCIALSQDDATEKAGLLLENCSFEPTAKAMILKDEGVLSVNNDLSIRLDRHVTFKFFVGKRIDKELAASIFYMSPLFDRYYALTMRVIELDPTTRTLVPHDYSSRLTSTHVEQSAIRIGSGALLEVSYSINFPYDEKIPDWRFQSSYPVEFSSLMLQVPDILKLKETLEGDYSPEKKIFREPTPIMHLNNQTQTHRVSERYYQFNELPSAMSEPFADHSWGQLERIHLHIISMIKDGDEKDEFSEEQIKHIIETLSSRSDFLLRLSAPLEIKSEYDRRIRAIADTVERVARIYDLVRRHITWNGVDSLSAPHPLTKAWGDKKGNSTEINLVLVKLLRDYGYDASPLITSTRNNGPIDTDEVSITDFNRTVAYVKTRTKNIVLDATGRFYDYPAKPASILNTRGLLISPDRNRWINIRDTTSLYKNSVTLLGHLSGDSSFLTNVYINSYGYAKPEHVEILEVDSLRGLRRYFERGKSNLRLKHFIAANEWVDTLPLAQEFDVKIPLNKNGGLTGVVPTCFSIPDTLFTISEDRKCDINFGYRQEYNLISEFTFPSNYELYLVPNNLQITALNGRAHFERDYHAGNTNFSLKQTLVIDKSVLTKAEAIELAKFLKKISALNVQQVVLKKNF